MSRSDPSSTSGSSTRLGPEPLAGLLLHLCVHTPEGGLRYIDVWESEERCARAFDERVHPAVDRAFGGARPPGEPIRHRLEVVHAAGSLLPDPVVSDRST